MSALDCRRTPVPVPVQETVVAVRHLFSIGRRLRAFALGMIVVPRAEQPSAPGCGLNEHSISTGSRRFIRDTMLHHVDIEAGAKRPTASLTNQSCSALHDLFNSKIKSLRVLLVEHGNSSPHFVRYFCALLGRGNGHLLLLLGSKRKHLSYECQLCFIHYIHCRNPEPPRVISFLAAGTAKYGLGNHL